MSYLNKRTLPQQQEKLKELIEQRLKNEELHIRQRVYQWLNDNQYFVDNELFDFYFCVAQNIAAVEVLGGSGKKIVKAKTELEQSAEAYTTQIVNTSNWIEGRLESQLTRVLKNQQELDTQLVQTLKRLEREKKNLEIISNGLVRSTSVLQKKQKYLLLKTESANKSALTLIIIAWVILVIALTIWLATSL